MTEFMPLQVLRESQCSSGHYQDHRETDHCNRVHGLVAMIPALGAGGPGFESRCAPNFSFNHFITLHNIEINYSHRQPYVCSSSTTRFLTSCICMILLYCTMKCIRTITDIMTLIKHIYCPVPIQFRYTKLKLTMKQNNATLQQK